TREALAGLENEFDVVAHETDEPIDLLGTVKRGADATVHLALRRQRFSQGRERTTHGHHRRQKLRDHPVCLPDLHAATPCWAAVCLWATLPAPNGSPRP